jgi:hypothetical protein
MQEDRTSARSGLRRHRPLLLAAFASALTALTAPGAEVFRCRTPEQAVLYSQFPCATPGSQARTGNVQETLQLNPVQTLQVPPLSDAERQRLAALEQQVERRHERQQTRWKSQMRNWSRDRQRRLARCSAARRQLEELAATRRRGYTAGEAQRLAARERELDAELAESC